MVIYIGDSVQLISNLFLNEFIIHIIIFQSSNQLWWTVKYTRIFLFHSAFLATCVENVINYLQLHFFWNNILKRSFSALKIYDHSPKTYGKDKLKRFANWQNEIELVTVHRYPNRNEGSNIPFGKSRSSMKHQVGVSGHCLLEWRFGGNSFRKEHTIYSLPTTAMFCEVLSPLRWL